MKSLKKIPVQLPDSLWNSLRKSALIRTPEEQRHHQLHNANVAEIPDTPYSKAVQRALGAVLALDSRTKNLNTIFKCGGETGLDLLLEGPNLLINEKWLDFYKSHIKAPCWLSHHSD